MVIGIFSVAEPPSERTAVTTSCVPAGAAGPFAAKLYADSQRPGAICAIDVSKPGRPIVIRATLVVVIAVKRTGVPFRTTVGAKVTEKIRTGSAGPARLLAGA